MAEVITLTTCFSVRPACNCSKPAFTPLAEISAALRRRAISAPDLTLRTDQTASLPSTRRAPGTPSSMPAKCSCPMWGCISETQFHAEHTAVPGLSRTGPPGSGAFPRSPSTYRTPWTEASGARLRSSTASPDVENRRMPSTPAPLRRAEPPGSRSGRRPRRRPVIRRSSAGLIARSAAGRPGRPASGRPAGACTFRRTPAAGNPKTPIVSPAAYPAVNSEFAQTTPHQYPCAAAAVRTIPARPFTQIRPGGKDGLRESFHADTRTRQEARHNRRRFSRTRGEIIRKFWDYINERGLQDTDRRMINADKDLQLVLGGKKQVNIFQVATLVSKHLKKPKPKIAGSKKTGASKAKKPANRRRQKKPRNHPRR